MAIIFPLLAMVPAFAYLELRTLIRDVQHDGFCEKAGIVWVDVNANDFAAASPQEPVYLRFTLDHGATLCASLVDPNLPNATPVFLPLFTEFGDAVLAPSDTVSVVRWKAGEPHIWLKVTSSSSTWLRVGDDVGPPTMDHRVTFSLGLSGQESQSAVAPYFDSGKANLPFQSRGSDPDQANSLGSVDLELKVDLSQGNLQPLPAPQDLSALNLDGGAFDHTTVGVETATNDSGISEGVPLSIAFLGDGMIGRGVFIGNYDVEYRWSNRSIHYRGSCEEGGMLVFRIASNIFPEASPQNPVYVRVQLNRAVTLCRTLVPPGSATPLYLAARLDAPDGTLLNMAPNAISVVRWVAGEDALWVKIVDGTGDWIRRGEDDTPPDQANSVSFYTGITAETSYDGSRDAFIRGEANLPFNTFDLSTDGSLSDAADLLIQLDASQSELDPGNPDLENVELDIQFYQEGTTGVETVEDPGRIETGSEVDVLTNDPPRIAHGLDLFPATRDTIDLRTLIRDVFYQGTCEQTGLMALVFSGNPFPDASPTTPTYLRLRLTGGARLCRTRVAAGPQPDPPIHLGLGLEPGHLAGARMVAAPDAISIVRWMAGEDAIWLKISQSPARWLQMSNSTTSPNIRDRVVMTLGNAPTDSFSRYADDFRNGLANLPCNTTNPQNSGNADEATDTRLELDLTTYIHPAPSLVELFPTGYDETTTGVTSETQANQIQLGTLVPVPFGGEITIGRTVETLPVTVTPEISVQGLEVITLEAQVPDGIVISQVTWTDLDTGTVLGNFPSLAYDPLPERTIRVRCHVIDNLGRTGDGFGIILVNPEGIDLNLDGKNTLEDLLYLTPRWEDGDSDVLEMMHINTGQN
ncbi:hypothetical protein [Sulfidibacter corallicola]|uniref:Uncharacterized protein n=1 Tax=Sulfidibacter corallicola TaxID=2818388 RepID=A0A8A4TXP7_SULCO|nr:hypothetical protein [Sulfidibacter corallicola]QTD53991.1 hypothetical protein J3U87_16215 [Sulfidibacter corallicola]